MSACQTCVSQAGLRGHHAWPKSALKNCECFELADCRACLCDSGMLVLNGGRSGPLHALNPAGVFFLCGRLPTDNYGAPQRIQFMAFLFVTSVGGHEAVKKQLMA